MDGNDWLRREGGGEMATRRKIRLLLSTHKNAQPVGGTEFFRLSALLLLCLLGGAPGFYVSKYSGWRRMVGNISFKSISSTTGPLECT